MIDKNINRFCELVSEINSLNKYLNKERSNFYDGGHSFEEIEKSNIEDLVSMQTELKEIINTIKI